MLFVYRFPTDAMGSRAPEQNIAFLLGNFTLGFLRDYWVLDNEI